MQSTHAPSTLLPSIIRRKQGRLRCSISPGINPNRVAVRADVCGEASVVIHRSQGIKPQRHLGSCSQGTVSTDKSSQLFWEDTFSHGIQCTWLHNSIKLDNFVSIFIPQPFFDKILSPFFLNYRRTQTQACLYEACLYETWMCLLLQRTLKMSSPPWQLFGHERYLDTSKHILLCGHSAELRHVQFYCEVVY